MRRGEAAVRLLGRLRAMAPRRWHGLLAFNYHRIGDLVASPFDRELWSATAEELDRQVVAIGQELEIVHPRDLPELQRRGRGRHALVTFDDGYRDNHDLAFDVLRRRGVPGAFFVTTGFLDGRRLAWWDEIAWMVRRASGTALPAHELWGGPVALDGDRGPAIRRLLRAYKALPGARAEEILSTLAEATGSGRCPEAEAADTWMTWDMVREMRDAGMAVGGHTVSHPVLARLGPDAQCAEIAGCARRLREELGEPMRWFAYPVGGRDAFDASTRAHLESNGVELAFSYYGGYRRYSDWDRFDVRRVPVEIYVPTDEVRAITRWPGLLGPPRGASWGDRLGDTLRGWTGT